MTSYNYKPIWETNSVVVQIRIMGALYPAAAFPENIRDGWSGTTTP